MSLTSQLDRYLAVRRSLGYDLSTSERILRRFTRFADRECATHIDTALFLRWHATLGEANRKVQIPYDHALYRQHHKIENMFGKLKDWRRIHTRYDRCAHTFMSAICVAAIVIFWLNQ